MVICKFKNHNNNFIIWFLDEINVNKTDNSYASIKNFFFQIEYNLLCC